MKKIIFAFACILAIVGCCAKKNGVSAGYTVLKQESYGGMETEGNLLVNSQEELVSLYKSVNVSPVPKIDFKDHSVVALFMGQKQSGGYAISVTDVVVKEATAAITVAKTSPTGMATMALTSPYCIVAIPKVASITIK
jgi:hypothetical protein